jgi:hypothetical protein
LSTRETFTLFSQQYACGHSFLSLRNLCPRTRFVCAQEEKRKRDTDLIAADFMNAKTAGVLHEEMKKSQFAKELDRAHQQIAHITINRYNEDPKKQWSWKRHWNAYCDILSPFFEPTCQDNRLALFKWDDVFDSTW